MVAYYLALVSPSAGDRQGQRRNALERVAVGRRVVGRWEHHISATC